MAENQLLAETTQSISIDEVKGIDLNQIDSMELKDGTLVVVQREEQLEGENEQFIEEEQQDFCEECVNNDELNEQSNQLRARPYMGRIGVPVATRGVMGPYGQPQRIGIPPKPVSYHHHRGPMGRIIPQGAGITLRGKGLIEVNETGTEYGKGMKGNQFGPQQGNQFGPQQGRNQFGPQGNQFGFGQQGRNQFGPQQGRNQFGPQGNQFGPQQGRNQFGPQQGNQFGFGQQGRNQFGPQGNQFGFGQQGRNQFGPQQGNQFGFGQQGRNQFGPQGNQFGFGQQGRNQFGPQGNQFGFGQQGRNQKQPTQTPNNTNLFRTRPNMVEEQEDFQEEEYYEEQYPCEEQYCECPDVVGDGTENQLRGRPYMMPKVMGHPVHMAHRVPPKQVIPILPQKRGPVHHGMNMGYNTYQPNRIFRARRTNVVVQPMFAPLNATFQPKNFGGYGFGGRHMRPVSHHYGRYANGPVAFRSRRRSKSYDAEECNNEYQEECDENTCVCTKCGKKF